MISFLNYTLLIHKARFPVSKLNWLKGLQLKRKLAMCECYMATLDHISEVKCFQAWKKCWILLATFVATGLHTNVFTWVSWISFWVFPGCVLACCRLLCGIGWMFLEKDGWSNLVLERMTYWRKPARPYPYQSFCLHERVLPSMPRFVFIHQL